MYYTGALILILLLVFGLLYGLGSQAYISSSRTVVERVVRDSFDHIEFSENSINVAGTLDLFTEGVSLLIYDGDGQLLLGSLPNTFPSSTPLISGQHQSIDATDGSAASWNVFDMVVSYRTSSIWVRGIYSASAAANLMQQLILGAAIVLPLLAILSVVLGYLITRRAFLPIQHINETVNEIQGSHDLARRIDLDPNRNDEIHELGENFNLLFERLQSRFEQEQQFTSDASHELRTPIAAIIAQAERGLDSDSSEGERMHALERVLVQAKTMSNTINQLLLLTRADRQTIKPDMETIDLRELCEFIIEAEEDVANAAGIRLMGRLDDEVIIQGDQSLLMRLVMNLVTNAIKYNKENGYVALDLTTQGDYAVLSVSDSGIGIPADEINKVFNRFYRSSQNRRRPSSGAGGGSDYSSGLGLSIVQWAVEAHDGTIEVQSNEGSGSTFIVRLPLNVKEDEQKD